MSAISTIKMTAKQFQQLGEDPPGVRLELVDGEIAVSPGPSLPHSNVIVQLTILLGSHINKHDLGKLFIDVDTTLDAYNVRRPDLLFYQKSRGHLLTTKYPAGVPDLGIEVISPGSIEIDRTHKFKQYEGAGIQFYWIVDPAKKTFEGYKLVDGKYELAGKASDNGTITLPPFEDLVIRVAELW